MLPENVKSLFSFFSRVLISVLLLVGVFYFMKIDTASIIQVVKEADIKYLMYAILIFFGIHGLILYRWRLLIKAVELDISIFQMARFFFLGLFGNLFLPSAVGGDIIKVVGLCHNSSQKPKVVASVILDRLSGFASIVIIAVTSFFLGYGLHKESSLIIPILGLGVGSLIIVCILFNETIYAFCCKIFAIFPKLRNGLMSIHYDIALLKNRKGEGYKAILISCLSQSLFALTYYFTAKALHQDIGLIYFFIFVPLICVSSAFPSLGGLGVREVGAVYLFGKIGIDSGITVSMTLLNFAFMILIGILGGMFYVLTLSSGRVQHNSQASTPS